MVKIAYVNSKYVEFKSAKIHIEDRGLQFGDSIYEVVAVLNKKLLDLRLHFKRLKFSLNELDIKYIVDEKKLVYIFTKLINKNLINNGVVYLQITRGVQNRNHLYKKNLKPTIIIYTQNKKFNIPNISFSGVKVITHVDIRWSRTDIKTTNLLPNILAQNLARKKNAYTAILLKNNKVTEGVNANIWIIKNKIIYTHPSNTDILKGITRTALIIIIKKFKLKLREKSFTKKQLYNADEVFLTSSSSFVTPIIKVDSKLISKGIVGKISLQLANFYLNASR
jgi:D-alanine transaminase